MYVCMYVCAHVVLASGTGQNQRRLNLTCYNTTGQTRKPIFNKKTKQSPQKQLGTVQMHEYVKPLQLQQTCLLSTAHQMSATMRRFQLVRDTRMQIFDNTDIANHMACKRMRFLHHTTLGNEKRCVKRNLENITQFEETEIRIDKKTKIPAMQRAPHPRRTR